MRKPGRESGFAMLLVFALAAAVAIVLYMELPRVAMEAQRSREQVLIDRGEQYQRGIQLYFRRFRKYPANLDQLDNTNNIRFLRRRYKDPMTGKDEWRLIHMGPGGMLTDSLTQKPPGQKKDEKASSSGGEGTSGQSGQEAPVLAMRRRASEMGSPIPVPGAGQPETPSVEDATNPAAPTPPQPETSPDASLTSYPAPGQPQPYPYPQIQPGQPYPYPQTQPQPGQNYPYPQTQAGQTYPYSQTPGQPQVYPYAQIQAGQVSPYVQGQTGQPQSYPGVQIFPGQAAYPSPTRGITVLPPPYGRPGVQAPVFPSQGAPVSSQTGGVSPTPFPTGAYGSSPSPYVPSASMQGGFRPGTPGGTNPNPAIEMIQRILTTPRPGGLGQATAQEGLTIGGGIAGVATTMEAEGIKVYNERTKYNEWEFIYDFRKDRTMMGAMGLAPGSGGAVSQSPQGQKQAMPASPFDTASPARTSGRGR